MPYPSCSAAELLQRAVHLESLVEELGGRKVVADVEPGFVDMPEQVFQVDDACELVEAPFADGIAVVGFPVDPFADLFRRHRGVDPYQFAAEGHDRLDRPVAQRKYAAHDLLLYLLHFAVLRTFLDDGAYLLLGDLRIRFAEPQQAGHACGAARQEPYERRGQQREQAHGRAASLAIFSAEFMPMRLGTSSPNMRVR